MSSPPSLLWTSWSSTSSSPHRVATSGWVVVGPCPSFQVKNLGQNLIGLDAVVARADIVFKQVNFCLQYRELVVEVAESVVVASVSLDFSRGVPVVKIGDGAAEGMKGGGWTDEEGVEPDGHRLHWFG